MRGKIFCAITVLAAVGCLSVPLPGYGQERAEYLLRGETSLTGTFLEPLQKRPVWYEAATENGMLTLRLSLPAQSVTLRLGQGELHVSSSNNTAGEFSTLSGEEREVLRQLVLHLEQKLETRSAFDESVLCALRNLGSWPDEMPLSVSMDSVTKTVGDVSVPMEEIREARRQALEDLKARHPGVELDVPDKTIVSLCGNIGSRRMACYPTSLVPYRLRCELTLVGGTTCRGRCGTTCNGLCAGQRYTQDCHDHDRCVDVYGLTHRYCNYIFPSASDDCTSATNCTDLPGVWNVSFAWAGRRPGRSTLNFFPSRRFTSADGALGTWSVTNSSLTFSVENGCKPVYTATLSTNRQTASGTMQCTTGSERGTWSATKTNGVLPSRSSRADEPVSGLEDGGALSNPPR